MDDNNLKMLQNYFFSCVADLTIYPEGSLEQIKAECSAGSALATVSELFGKKESESLREAAIKKWPELDEAYSNLRFRKETHNG